MIDAVNAKPKLSDDLAVDLAAIIPERIFDDSVGETVYQVEHVDEWIEVTETVFRSWTGLRRINGDDHHGPVYNFGSIGESKPYTGKRVCGCSVCQESVTPKLKVN